MVVLANAESSNTHKLKLRYDITFGDNGSKELKEMDISTSIFSMPAKTAVFADCFSSSDELDYCFAVMDEQKNCEFYPFSILIQEGQNKSYNVKG